jgi:hypothetical protein
MKTGRFVDNYGTIMYFLNGKYHREDGPAIEFDNGDKQYLINDEFHRLDGPAVEFSSPSLSHLNKWYYKGQFIKCENQQEFERFLRLKAFL